MVLQFPIFLDGISSCRVYLRGGVERQDHRVRCAGNGTEDAFLEKIRFLEKFVNKKDNKKIEYGSNLFCLRNDFSNKFISSKKMGLLGFYGVIGNEICSDC